MDRAWPYSHVREQSECESNKNCDEKMNAARGVGFQSDGGDESVTTQFGTFVFAQD